MSHRKTDLGIPCRSKSAKVVLGVVALKDTPAAIIEMVNNAINAGLADAKVKQTIIDWGETVFASSPAEFGRFIAAENEKWGKVIRAANIKL